MVIFNVLIIFPCGRTLNVSQSDCDSEDALAWSRKHDTTDLICVNKDTRLDAICLSNLRHGKFQPPCSRLLRIRDHIMEQEQIVKPSQRAYFFNLWQRSSKKLVSAWWPTLSVDQDLSSEWHWWHCTRLWQPFKTLKLSSTYGSNGLLRAAYQNIDWCFNFVLAYSTCGCLLMDKFSTAGHKTSQALVFTSVSELKAFILRIKVE